jgi:hypothetical protein
MYARISSSEWVAASSFVALGRIDPVIVGMSDRRRRDAEVHLARAGLAHHADDLHRRRATDDRIVDQNDPLAGDDRTIGAVLEPHAQLARRLRRLDEGAADVMVADDAELERHAGGLRIADRGRHAGIGHRNHDVRFGRHLAREFRAHVLADLVDGPALHEGIGAGEIDVLEDAWPRRHPRERPQALDPALGDVDDLAVLDVADEPGTDDVERTRLGGQQVMAVEFAEHQRPDAERVAGTDQRLLESVTSA